MGPTTARRKVNPVTDRRVMNLYNEGWHLPNIVRIARLERHKVIIDKIER